MTLLGVLTGLAVLGAILLVVVLFTQRGREGLDLSLGGLLRIYLYLGSLAGVVVIAAGLAGLIAYVLAAGLGLDVIYGGRDSGPVGFPPCPAGADCPEILRQFPDDRLRRHSEDLVRGVTFLSFGGIFWGAHWAARRSVSPPSGPLHRTYLILGTAVFGVATIALLPFGIYQALSFALIPGQQGFFRPGAGEALSGGLAALPLWLAYLWLVLRALRGGDPRAYAGPGPSGPPPEPALAGARVGPGPSSRSAGAEARPPETT